MRFAIALVMAASGISCWGNLLLDPLHGYCAPAATQCIDNNTNSPTSTNAPSNFGFTISPGPASGDLLIDILAPDNEAQGPSYGLTGTLTGTATLFSATPWTSGDLDAYLGFSASPANPIGAYLPSTIALDPDATGFFVYQVNFGMQTLQGPSNPNVGLLENISSEIPEASYIVGFLNKGTADKPDWIATANSGAIFETDGPPGIASTPEPRSIILLGSILCLVGRRIYLSYHPKTGHPGT